MFPASRLQSAKRSLADDCQSRYEILVEHAPLGMCEVSRDGRLRWVNRAFVEMLGYDNARELSILFSERPFLIDEALLSRFTAPGRSAPVETKWCRKDGQPVVVRLRGAAVPRSARPVELPATVAIIAEDITERRDLEDRLRLAHKLEAVGRLAGGIAHDFNNMLTAIVGYSDLLLEQLDEQKPIFPDLEEIKKAANRAATLTHQLLAFSRRQVLKLQPLDLNSVVRDLEPMIRRLIGEHITVETHFTDSLPIITADRSQIEQVLVNLALNARDAMPKGGALSFETSTTTLDTMRATSQSEGEAGDFVRLRVADSGVGMTAEIKSQIFDPFFTTKEVGQGTGLGLASVYGIVQQLGGQIWVDSEPNHGTVFELSFPRTLDAEVENASVTDRHGQPVGSESVLLVEDEETVRMFCKTVLHRHGYRVLEAANASEAFKVAEAASGPIKLILTDVVMPGMNGPQMVQRLREVLPQFKTLYMSGYAEQLRRLGDVEAELLEKPFTAADLLGRVRELLDRAS